ncbi:hypothetical protein EWM64_g543 [Hericium alpestre]|uniref:Major facilitator superfamily (MFS) profile domain-containing protein n=1 Tax=Hericium alpestre TaxID=135208 RepID=A0A4Z0A8T9_9AGAM|nr:hypothetical protein EWM64_g543 [Hericium alpestre]
MAEPKEAVSISTATVSQRLSGRRLLRAINAVAGLSIFFFGYDQGVMAGVNSAPDYVETMGLGHSSYGGPSEGWVAVVTKPTRQGGIVSIYYLGTLLGCLAAGVIGDRLGRIKTIFFIIPMIGLLVSLPWMPESPRWLVKAGHHGAAREILGRLRSDGNPDDPRTVTEYQDIVGIVELERKHASDNTYIGMFFGSKDGELNIPRRVQLAFWLMIVQEWVGIAAVQVYAPTVFAQAGYGARKTQWMSGVNDITYALSTFTCEL